MATTAMFLALGGGAYAATALPRNSVGNDQLKRGAVTKSKIAQYSVGRSELLREGVTKGSLSHWVRRHVEQRARRGSTGPAGAQGTSGARGPAGSAGPGAKQISYSSDASATPSAVNVFDLGYLRMDLSCEQSGADTNVLFTAHSNEAGTIQETIATDGGSDPSYSPADMANVKFDIPAGTTGFPASDGVSSGYARSSIDGVYTSAGHTVQLRLIVFIDADADKCSATGVAVPAS